jgi:hypothetical protein
LISHQTAWEDIEGDNRRSIRDIKRFVIAGKDNTIGLQAFTELCNFTCAAGVLDLAESEPAQNHLTESEIDAALAIRGKIIWISKVTKRLVFKGVC